MTSIKEYRIKWRKEGKCLNCGKIKESNRINKNYCLHCQDLHLKPQRKLKLQALKIVSGKEFPICSSCGCDIFKILDINHKKFRTKEEKIRYAKDFHLLYKEITDGKIEIKELEVLCKLCNWKHFLQFKFGIEWRINWIPSHIKV